VVDEAHDMELLRYFRSRESALALIIVILIGGVGLRAPVFATPANLLNVLTDTSLLSMLALGQMAVLLTRNIDLSVAANLALMGMVTAVSAHFAHLPVALLLPMAAGGGLILGLINSLLVAILRIPSIVVTLGTLAIYRGIIFFSVGNIWLPADYMPDDFKSFPYARSLELPHLLWIAVLIAIAMYVFLNFSRPGRALYAVGGNPVAAEYCGISICAAQILAFAISGAIAGLCGYLWVARYGIAYYGIAQGYEFTIIAACVIGGVSFGGGVGSVPSVLLGALLLGLIVNALPVIKVSPFWQTEISGLVILAAVLISSQSFNATSRRGTLAVLQK
jgi:rhamnose transport system permease protein